MLYIYIVSIYCILYITIGDQNKVTIKVGRQKHIGHWFYHFPRRKMKNCSLNDFFLYLISNFIQGQWGVVGIIPFATHKPATRNLVIKYG